MLTQQILNIHNSYDIIMIRMQVREAARRAGLVPGDQARISLATSSLLEGLDSGFDAVSTSIVIEQLIEGGKTGLRVAFTFANPREHQSLKTAAGKISWMVDNIAINYLENNKVEIILLKWVMEKRL